MGSILCGLWGETQDSSRYNICASSNLNVLEQSFAKIRRSCSDNSWANALEAFRPAYISCLVAGLHGTFTPFKTTFWFILSKCLVVPPPCQHPWLKEKGSLFRCNEGFERRGKANLCLRFFNCHTRTGLCGLHRNCCWTRKYVTFETRWLFSLWVLRRDTWFVSRVCIYSSSSDVARVGRSCCNHSSTSSSQVLVYYCD
jgi:hypothetical protein